MANNNGNANGETTFKLKGLDPAKLAELLGKSRTRNAYGPKLITFMDSDEAAVDVVDLSPIEFQNKQATTLYQGFNLAIKKANLEDTLELRQSDGHVFLLHKERVALAIAS